jgi:hypothetical protein
MAFSCSASPQLLPCVAVALHLLSMQGMWKAVETCSAKRALTDDSV